jgi:hypothetical protein
MVSDHAWGTTEYDQQIITQQLLISITSSWCQLRRSRCSPGFGQLRSFYTCVYTV